MFLRRGYLIYPMNPRSLFILVAMGTRNALLSELIFTFGSNMCLKLPSGNNKNPNQMMIIRILYIVLDNRNNFVFCLRLFFKSIFISFGILIVFNTLYNLQQNNIRIFRLSNSVHFYKYMPVIKNNI